jgi:hypothetical protein
MRKCKQTGQLTRTPPPSEKFFGFIMQGTGCGTMPVVFIHCPYSNPHPPQMGRVWVKNNYPLKKWGG